MIEVCDIVEYGLDSWGKEPQTWRVTHHLKRIEDTLDDWNPTDFMEKITRDIGLRFREKERAERKAKGLSCTRRYRLVYCKPEEATHVELVCICGALAPISECKKVRVVDWSEKLIQQTKAEAVRDFWLNDQLFPIWEWE